METNVFFSGYHLAFADVWRNENPVSGCPRRSNAIKEGSSEVSPYDFDVSTAEAFSLRPFLFCQFQGSSTILDKLHIKWIAWI
jgi:hypothetical protein